MKQVLCIFACCFLLFGGPADADFESEVIDLVNVERAAAGLSPLSYDASLADAARGHSADMGRQDYFSHTSLDGRTAGDRIEDAGYTWNAYGENIAAGQPTPEDVIDGWMSSPGHRANILDPNFCDIGVGYAYIAASTYRHYWTQDFGRQSGVSACPQTVTHTITAAAGAGGSIAPQGNVPAAQGGDVTFTITPDAGYSVAEVLVDGEAVDITTTYAFLNVGSNHSIAVEFAPNQFAPTAEAGPDQEVVEGATVTLDGSRSSDSNDAIVTYHWTQTGGPAITLSDANAVRPTLVAAPITEDALLVFQLTVYDSGSDSDSDTVRISVTENELHSVPDDAIAFKTSANSVLGFKPESNANMVSLLAVDPQSDEIIDRSGMPQDLIYGLMDFKLKVDPPGSSTTLTVYLPEPLPQGYRWYKYSQSQGWYDYSSNVSLNADRTRLSLTLADGGIGDDDGQPNGIIQDPSGLGTAGSATVSDPTTSSGGGSAGGCFIGTLGAAFKTLEISNHTEQFNIEALRAAKALTVSLVAEQNGCEIGHIAFSPVTISDGTQNWYGLGPVSVLPENQRQGIDKSPVREGLLRLKKLNAQDCCFVGHPDDYRKFGFKNTPGFVYKGVPEAEFLFLSFDGHYPRGSVTFHEGFKTDVVESGRRVD